MIVYEDNMVSVPAPTQPLIQDDDADFTFSKYIVHDKQSPATPSAYSGSSFSFSSVDTGFAFAGGMATPVYPLSATTTATSFPISTDFTTSPFSTTASSFSFSPSLTSPFQTPSPFQFSFTPPPPTSTYTELHHPQRTQSLPQPQVQPQSNYQTQQSYQPPLQEQFQQQQPQQPQQQQFQQQQPQQQQRPQQQQQRQQQSTYPQIQTRPGPVLSLSTHARTQAQATQRNIAPKPQRASTYPQPQPQSQSQSPQSQLQMQQQSQAKPQPPQEPESKRPHGACTRCKKMKMKCTFPDPSNPSCQRCLTGKFPCVVEGRKPRTPSRREYLLGQIRIKDAEIATLLRSYSSLGQTPILLSGSKLIQELGNDLSPGERAALGWVDRGKSGKNAPAATVGMNKGGGGVAKKDKKKIKDEECSDDEWEQREDGDGESSESEDEGSVWDGEAERRWDEIAGPSDGAEPPSTARMHLHALPERNAPMGFIARVALEEDDEDATEKNGGVKRGRDDNANPEENDEDAEDDGDWGIANKEYFMPGPTSNLPLRRILNGREAPPAIIASGLVNWDEAKTLFAIFFEHVSPFVSILDPVLHTVSSVYERCPFLFTVVCAISSRYLPSRPGLHKIAMHFAKTAAATAFVDGVKSVELAQAYLLMGVYGLPARKWEEDRSWFYGGLASRIATDLGLYRASSTKPLSERHERELLNRTRTWLNCFNVDRSSATQWGKPTGLQEDEVIRNAKDWYKRSKYNHAHDVHLVAYTGLLCIVSRFHEQVYSDQKSPTGLNKRCDFRAITETTEAEIKMWHDDVAWKYENDSDPNDPGCVFRAKGVPVFENYMRLVMYSFGFEEAWKRRGVEPGDMFFAKCLQSATAVVQQLIEVYATSGYLKYAPDCYFVMGGFSSAFLLKMFRPEFRTLLDEDQRTRIITIVQRFVDVLASPEASIDETHTPKLYAKFLHGQLRHVTTEREAESEQQCQPQAQDTVSGFYQPNVEEDIPDKSQTSTLMLGQDLFPTPALSPMPLFSHSTPSAHSSMSSANSSVPTPGPDFDAQSLGWPDNMTEGASSGSGSATAAAPVHDDPMELCEDEFLATMQAVSSDQWLHSVLMPGFRWPLEEPLPLGQEGGLIVGSN